jgi:hypothetical protein
MSNCSDRFWWKKITTYASIIIPGALAGSLVVIDRILINKFITPADVGVYLAYFFPIHNHNLHALGHFQRWLFPIRV